MKRSCGPCSACCTSIQVRAFNKPAHAPCSKWARGESDSTGCCSTYADRPSECQDYSCEWLNGNYGGEGDRPDLSGVIVETAHADDGSLHVAFLATAPGFDERSDGWLRAKDIFTRLGWLVFASKKGAPPRAVAGTPEQYERFMKAIWQFKDATILPGGRMVER